MNDATYTYDPDYLCIPGDTLGELLDERGMSLDNAATATGLDMIQIASIINAGSAITTEIAQMLETAFNTPASFWLNLQRNYDAWVARKHIQGRWYGCQERYIDMTLK